MNKLKKNDGNVSIKRDKQVSKVNVELITVKYPYPIGFVDIPIQTVNHLCAPKPIKSKILAIKIELHDFLRLTTLSSMRTSFLFVIVFIGREIFPRYILILQFFPNRFQQYFINELQVREIYIYNS